MADTSSDHSDKIVLKILNGAQSGVEVALRNGDYTLGSGHDDDIQLIDISLKPEHLKLRVSSGKIEITGGAGDVSSVNGLSVAASSREWQAIEPLDVLSAGGSRFAFGPSTAQWSTITEEQKSQEEAPPPPPSSPPLPLPPFLAHLLERGHPHLSTFKRAWPKWRPIALPALGVGALFFLALFWFVSASSDVVLPEQNQKTDLQIAQEIIARFPFARNIQIKEEVDGTLFATGYVQTLAERRAILSAIEEENSPLRARVYVLSAIEQEVKTLMQRYGEGTRYTLSSNGTLVLEGILLNAERADRLVSVMKQDVAGISSVVSRIKTAPVLLKDVENLANQSKIQDTVVLRLDGELIEANGVIPSSKVDAWVGFMQAYASRFAEDIPLRSYVQLVSDAMVPTQNAGQAPASRPEKAVVLNGKRGPQAQEGEEDKKTGDISLDLDRLKRGTYEIGEIFASPTKGSSEQAISEVQALVSNQQSEGLGNTLSAGGRGVPSGSTLTFSDLSKGMPPQNTPAGQEVAPLSPPTLLNQTANGLLKNWAQEDGSSSASGALTKNLNAALDTLTSIWQKGEALALNLTEEEKRRQRQALEKQMLPLFSRSFSDALTNQEACWPSSSLTRKNLTTVLFWIDLLSISDTLSLSSFTPQDQSQILEAALSPKKVTQCAETIIAQDGKSLAERSLYLQEIKRNPNFIGFLVRDISASPIDITGVNLGQSKYLQTKQGDKLMEGAAPNGASRISYIGELGVSFQNRDGFSALVYARNLVWLNMGQQ